MSGQLQIDSVCDLVRNLRELAGKRDDVAMLREGEAMARWAAQNTGNARSRGRVLFELARTLDDLGRKLGDPAVVADAVAAGEGAVLMASSPVRQHLRNTVVDGIRQNLRKLDGPPDVPPPPL